MPWSARLPGYGVWCRYCCGSTHTAVKAAELHEEVAAFPAYGVWLLRHSGFLSNPQVLTIAQYADAAGQLAEQLAPAGPGHPWEGVRLTSSWGSRAPLDVVLVAPALVAEIVVDTAHERGAWRHPVRFARLCADVALADVPPFGAGAAPSAG